MKTHLAVRDKKKKTYGIICLNGGFACFNALTINGLPFSLLPPVTYQWRLLFSMHFRIIV